LFFDALGFALRAREIDDPFLGDLMLQQTLHGGFGTLARSEYSHGGFHEKLLF
jgi:hypothetical protein